MFIAHVPEAEASGAVADIYEEERKSWGYLPNYARLFSHRPQVLEGWGRLIGSIRAGMDRRLYELATLAAATTIRSSYCSLAHGKFLTAFYQPDQVAELAIDRTVLPPAEQELMAFAAKVARDASAITLDDVDRLRAVGFSDTDVFDIAAAAAARCFFAKLLDALGAAPDAELTELGPEMCDALTVGRAIAAG